jgi:HEAT repeat protein
MSIRFRCAHCRRALAVAARQAGHSMRCPRCKEEIVVPAASNLAPPERNSATTARVPEKTTRSKVVAPPTSFNPAEDSSAVLVKRRNLSSRYALVAVAVGCFMFVAAGGTAIGGWAAWRHFAVGHEAQFDESSEDGDETRLTDATPTAKTLDSENPADEVPNIDQPAPGTPEEEKKEESPKPDLPSVKPAPEKARPAAADKVVIKRRTDVLEEDLRKELQWSPEISMTADDIPHVADAFLTRVYTANKEQKGVNLEPTYIQARLSEFKTLPYRRGYSHLIESKAKGELQTLGRELHLLLDRLAAREEDYRPNAVKLGEFLKAEKGRDNKPTWMRPEAVPTLQQVLGHEDLGVRLLLVDLLTRIEGRAAGLALVQHAVFDVSPEVRDAAIKGLDARPREQYRSGLVAALRYPWAPAANHAAEALVALKDADAAPLLVKLLKEPDPSAPVVKKDGLWKREVVRINHQDNCLACHPPAWLGNDPVQRVVPGFTVVNNRKVVPTSSLAPAAQTVIETGGVVKVPSIKPADGNPKYGNGPRIVTTSATALTVRGDITYLRQDFSMQQPVRVPGAGQTIDMRFDYVVRFRPLTDKQTHEWKTQTHRPAEYEQREAVLFALRGLTGQDAGPSTEAWEKLYPQSEFESLAADLTTALVGASDFQKPTVTKKLRDGKGEENTAALAQAIPQLSGVFQEKARAALVERLKRMSVKALRDKLADENHEIRRAAATASGSKEEAAALIPDLTALTADPDEAVAEAAAAAIKALRAREGKSEDDGDSY